VGVRFLWTARVFKIAAVQSCPYAETLYLDNDAAVQNASQSLAWFDRMGRRAVLSGRQFGPSRLATRTTLVPDNFREIQSGVLYVRCPAAQPLLQRWRELYQSKANQQLVSNDQFTLRIAVYEMGREDSTRFAGLPARYHCRPEARLNGSCVVVHDHVSKGGVCVSPGFPAHDARRRPGRPPYRRATLTAPHRIPGRP
jgi:hypothetical protein